MMPAGYWYPMITLATLRRTTILANADPYHAMLVLECIMSPCLVVLERIAKE